MIGATENVGPGRPDRHETIVWLRRNPRLADNPALAAVARGPILRVHILGDDEAGDGAASAPPSFRIFNPALQGEKFDPDGLISAAGYRSWPARPTS